MLTNNITNPHPHVITYTDYNKFICYICQIFDNKNVK